MSDLRNAMQHHDSKTRNNAVTHSTSGSACLDFFAKAGGMRGDNILPLFYNALAENEDVAIRIALWLRDIRGGAGERVLFRDIFHSLSQTNREIALQLIPKIPEVGRWDDLFSFSDDTQDECLQYMAEALRKGDGLCAKWMPRENSSKGILGYLLRKEMDLSSRQYRKMLASLSKTVEQQMSANKWKFINYQHVPSQAMKIYNRAFNRRDHERFVEYLEAVKSGTKKINAGAIHPHELIGKYIGYGMTSVDKYYHCKSQTVHSKVENDAIEAQWYALPDYVKDNNNSSICICDTSGSMSGLPIQVAVSLSIYFAERNVGPFKDEFITFSEAPEFQVLQGITLQQKVHSLLKTRWSQNTNLRAVFDMILERAVQSKIPDANMPKNLIIISDMEFDKATKGNKITNYESIRKQYKKHNYTMPKVIFWNVNATLSRNNSPVKEDEQGTALISGFSPSILESVMSNRFATPYETMLNKVMVNKYDWRINERV